MLRWLVGGAALAALGLGFVACGDSSTTAGACEPGTEVFCKCRGGFEGTKTCLDDGNSFGECTTPEGSCPEIPDTTSSTGPTQICIPDEEVPCTCDETGDPGNKTCASDGLSFGDCTTVDGPCGSSTTGDKLLYDACATGSECQTGVCDGGYCTRSCEDYTVCYIEADELYGDCIQLEGGAKQQCAPYCIDQSACAAYGADSLCGGANALDDPSLGFAACASWGDDVQGMPAGTLCDSETGEVFYLFDLAIMPCDIGLEGIETICLFGECSEGCEENADCPNFDCHPTLPCCESNANCG
ncbi:MAG: hypothetical protein IPM79_14490 [Polyangiaceae bacterium]|jgi:hypothetical protein|nr:hypothetical protein [Polyangiaceae bacterium]MBK8938794.1 hypothetical protein [Polyangiaceae bacterium]